MGQTERKDRAIIVFNNYSGVVIGVFTNMHVVAESFDISYHTLRKKIKHQHEYVNDQYRIIRIPIIHVQNKLLQISIER